MTLFFVGFFIIIILPPLSKLESKENRWIGIQMLLSVDEPDDLYCELLSSNEFDAHV